MIDSPNPRNGVPDEKDGKQANIIKGRQGTAKMIAEKYSNIGATGQIVRQVLSPPQRIS
jgi:hypothetical protein